MKFSHLFNNWGSREPLSTKVCTTLYLHIVRVWLDACADSPIDLALRSDNRTNLRELQDLLRKPGLILRLTYRDSNDGNVEKRLTEEEYESILALESFINNLQNNYGPIEYGMFDITTVSYHHFECFVATSFDIQQPIAYDEEKAIASRERRLEVLQRYSLEDDTNPIAMKEIDAPPPDDSYPTWEEINWEDYPYEEESGRFASDYHYARYVLSQPRVPIRLQQSMTAISIYGSIDTEQMIRVASSIGFGQLVRQSPTTNYDHNLLSDVGELADLLEKYDGGMERLMALIKMIGDYFQEHKTTIMFERPDMLLRNLILEAIHEVIYGKVAMDSISILRSSIVNTSHRHHITLPEINDPNNNDSLVHGPMPTSSLTNNSINTNTQGGVNVVGLVDGEAINNNTNKEKDSGEYIITTEDIIHDGGIVETNEQYDLSGNNDRQDEYAQHTRYRRIENKDIHMWGSRCNIQLHSRSGTNDLKGKARNEWEAIALRALLTDGVSKYVKDAVSSYAIRDWQWLARLVEKLTHRGLLCYMVYIIATTAGLIIHATSFAEISWKPLARKNNINHLIIFGASMDTAGSMICDNNSISLKTVDIDSTIRYSIQSSRGRISTTYHTSNDVPIDVLPHITDESSLEPSSQTKYSHLSAVNAKYSYLSAVNDATTSPKEAMQYYDGPRMSDQKEKPRLQVPIVDIVPNNGTNSIQSIGNEFIVRSIGNEFIISTMIQRTLQFLTNRGVEDSLFNDDLIGYANREANAALDIRQSLAANAALDIRRSLAQSEGLMNEYPIGDHTPCVEGSYDEQASVTSKEYHRIEYLTRHDHTQQFSDDLSSRGDKASSIVTSEDGKTISSYPKSNLNENMEEVQVKSTTCRGQFIPTNIDRLYVNKCIILPNEMEHTECDKLNGTSQFDLSGVNNDQANRGALTYRYVAQSLSPVPYGTFTEYTVGTQLDSYSGRQLAQGICFRTEYSEDPTQMHSHSDNRRGSSITSSALSCNGGSASGSRNGRGQHGLEVVSSVVYTESNRERDAPSSILS